MPKSKIFASTVFLLVILLIAGGAMAKPMIWSNDDRPVVQLSPRAESGDFGRDSDEFLTFRWMYSSDGGENWNDKTIYGAGATGMIDTTGGVQTAGWPQVAYRFGVVADGQNQLHFVAVLNGFLTGEFNPSGRVNGLYDVICSANGATIDYHLIVEQREDREFVWSDCGIDAEGNLFAIYVEVNGDQAGIKATKSTDGGTTWSEPFAVVTGLDVTGGQESIMPYPHMTPKVDSDYFYVIYQTPVEGTWAHKVAKVPSALSGDVTIAETGAASAAYVSYYVGGVSPIDMDPATDPATVYFAVRDAGGGTAIGNLAGDQWSVSRLVGAQRYPSCGLNVADQIPFVFSNYGVPAGGAPHKAWMSWDDLGYNGGSWLPPTDVDSIAYDGVRDLLYCNQGVWTSEGRLVYGSNVWGQFTPEGFQVKYSDDAGETWSDRNKLWSIFDEGETMSGGFIAQNALVAGANNHVFVAFCGKWGATDFDGPTVGEPTLSSFRLEEPWTVTCPLNDLNGIGDAWVNWYNVNADAPEWAAASYDTILMADALNNGTFQFTIPNDTLFESGDSVWIYVDGVDQLNNYAAGWENLLIVGTGYTGVSRTVELPTEVSLGQNYPNPFNNSTVIPFALNRTERITVQVWDTNGRLVSTVVDGVASAGRHQVSWNPQDVSSGIYIYTLQTNSQRFIGKMTLVH